jgi:Spy/CpxP family protein refolding chaperone
MNARVSQVRLVAAVVLGGLLVCCPVTTQGANLGGPAGAKLALARERFQDIAAQLQLTDQQKQQIKPILREEAQKLKSLRAETGLTKQQKHAQLKQIRQDLLARIKPILTPEQLAKWQTLRGELRGRHHVSSQPNATGL